MSFTKVSKVRFSPDANNIVSMSDDDFRKIWKYSHQDVVEWCRKNIPNFKQSKIFYDAKKSILNDENCVYERRLDNTNTKSASQKFYTEYALEKIKEFYINYQE